MQYMVIVNELCPCSRKDGLTQIVAFDDKEDAKVSALDKIDFMEKNFCGKHKFKLTEVNEHFVIGLIRV